MENCCTLCTLGDPPGCNACRAEEPEGEPAPSIVYRIRHVPTGRVYVGKHRIDGDPFEDDGYRGSGLHLARAIDSYGWGEFDKVVLAVCPTEEGALLLEGGLVGPEQVASDRYFNLCVGGLGVAGLTEESKARIRAANAARELDPEFKARHAEATGLAAQRAWARLTPEERERWVTNITAPRRTPEGRALIGDLSRAVWDSYTPEERALRASKSVEGNRTDAARDKNRRTQLQRYGDPAEGAKTSAAVREFWDSLSDEERAARTAAAVERLHAPEVVAKRREAQRRAWSLLSQGERQRRSEALAEGQRRRRAEDPARYEVRDAAISERQKSYWASMTPDERSAEVKRRKAVARERKRRERDG